MGRLIASPGSVVADEHQDTTVSVGDSGTRGAASADSLPGHVADLIRIATDSPPGDCVAVAPEFGAVAIDQTVVLAGQAEGVT